jgi:hypothetical protein
VLRLRQIGPLEGIEIFDDMGEPLPQTPCTDLFKVEMKVRKTGPDRELVKAECPVFVTAEMVAQQQAHGYFDVRIPFRDLTLVNGHLERGVPAEELCLTFENRNIPSAQHSHLGLHSVVLTEHAGQSVDDLLVESRANLPPLPVLVPNLPSGRRLSDEQIAKSVFVVREKPSGKSGDSGDATIGQGDEGHPLMRFGLQGRGPHSWDYQFARDSAGNALLDPEGNPVPNDRPATFVGVHWLAPANNWGVQDNGGYDLRPLHPAKLTWEARVVRDDSSSMNKVAEHRWVQFTAGGVQRGWQQSRDASGQSAWKWDELPHGDTLRQVMLGDPVKLTHDWQPFEAPLDVSADELRRVVGLFGAQVNWPAAGVDDGSAPGTEYRFEVRNIQYRRISEPHDQR